MNSKVKAAAVSIFSNSFLIAIKVVVGIFTGSVSIISEAIHSGMDLMASFVAFFSVRISDKPADEDHPFGHGKFENVSGVIEALLIFAAAGWIIYESIEALYHPRELENLTWALAVMGVSSVTNFFVSRYLYRVARKTRSIALEADALHLKADVLTSGGIFVGLGIIMLTGYTFLDPVIAILVAIYILYESYLLLRNAFNPLIDKAIPAEEMKIIEEILAAYTYHHFRTRQSGHYRFVDFHLELPGSVSLEKVHDICDQIEKAIEERLDHTEVTIHVEPIHEKEH
jgi:cation diffusion facilitator family transporter